MGYRVKSVEVHAVGLRLPTHLAMTEDDRLYVSEFAGGAVRDITEKGNYADAVRGNFVDDLDHPGGLLSIEGRLLIADTGNGNIYQTAGMGGTDSIVGKVPNPYGLVAFQGRVLVSYFTDGTVGLVDLKELDGGFSVDAAEVADFPCITVSEPFREVEAYGGSWSATGLQGRLLLCHAGLGTIFDVTGGGTFSDLRHNRFAWGLNGPAGMIADPNDDELYVCEKGTGVIRHLVYPGYARFSDPLLAGFLEPVCIRFNGHGDKAYVADRAAGSVYVAELGRTGS